MKRYLLFLLLSLAALAGLHAQRGPAPAATDTTGNRPQCPAPAIDLGVDRRLCAGDSLVLDAGPGFSSYLWGSGETTRTLVARTAGRYSVIGTTAGGCEARDQMDVLDVLPAPVVNLPQQLEVCTGSTRMIDAGTFASYRWQDGSTGRVFVIMSAGIYSVQVVDFNGCTGTGTINVTAATGGPRLDLPSDTTLCQYQRLILRAPAGNYASYLWSTGSLAASEEVPGPGLYWLQVANEAGCAVRDSIRVHVRECSRYFFVPTAFTPDGDGLNDRFKPLLDGNVLSYHFSIYDRWGRIVFETTDPRKGWDGKRGNTEQPSNVYVWTCSFHLEGGPPETRKGTFTVIR